MLPTALTPAAADLAEGSLLTRGTIDAYITAVIKLWRLQVAHGNANTENPQGAAVRGFLEQRGRQQGKHDRASFKDRGTDGIQAGYSPDKWLRVQDLLLSRAVYIPQNLHTRVNLLFSHYYLLQGENRRKIELTDLSLLNYLSSEGPTPYSCLITLLRDRPLILYASGLSTALLLALARRRRAVPVLPTPPGLVSDQGSYQTGPRAGALIPDAATRDLAYLRYCWPYSVKEDAPPAQGRRPGHRDPQHVARPDLTGRPPEPERALPGLSYTSTAPVHAYYRQLLGITRGLFSRVRPTSPHMSYKSSSGRRSRSRSLALRLARAGNTGQKVASTTTT
ncbi:hypothetical protein FNYG_13437 [Fusarium nygamai]|uniref:Uncharacterized protein n=1 Tax=Gibberella nygamai TaxID=42673 RepID=A0A2K0VT70_GIBNY|nr:hypothetical protein FNYG_13437 [Fusarium nygamai]